MKARNPISQAVLISSVTLFGALVPATVLADRCLEGWDRPVVCELELEARQRDSDRRFNPRGDLRLEPGQTLRLSTLARDQEGRSFDSRRLYIGLDLESQCDKFVRVSRVSPTEFDVVAAADEFGECRGWLYVPGNENLEWRLDLKVARPRPVPSRGSGGSEYVDPVDDARGRYIADSLYRAILSRGMDDVGAAGAVARVLAGDVDGLMTSMFKSGEFVNRKTGRKPEDMLTQFYRGMLGRDPDPQGSGGYLEDLRRGKYGEVLKKLLQSTEFQKRLDAAAPKENPAAPNEKEQRRNPFHR